MASTLRSYELSWGAHVAQRWGGVRICDVRYSDVQAWVAELSSRRGPGTVRIAYSVLARILDDAVRDRLIGANQARGVKLPKLPPRRNTYLTAVQLQRLADESGRYKSLVLVLGVGGLRLGEAAALRVSDVDFLRRRVELSRNAVKVGGEFVVGSLKNHKNRSVALPAFVTDELARRVKERAAMSCSGRHRAADTSAGRRCGKRPGWQWRWGAAAKPIRRFPA
jgi:integrase